MIEKTQAVQKRFDEITEMASNPEIIADQKEWRKLMKERASLEELVSVRAELIKLVQEAKQIHKTIQTEKDSEILELFEAEYRICKEKINQTEEQLKMMLLPKDENDDNNVIMELRAGVGGEESALFASVLLNMYRLFSERNRWKVEINDISETELGGIKECSFTIIGKGAYAKLKYESGVHRVQRVPDTESQGRVHTSTTTVAVLPEVEDIDFEILDKDIRIDTYRSSGAGGQKVNKTDSAIRITHIPTGMVVSCQDERSQFKNKDKAFGILKSKLYDFYRTQRDSEYAENRKSQIGSGERCERIRTYNYPQGRITDHRINYTSYNLEGFLNGDIADLIENLAIADRKEKLERALKNN